MPDTPPDPAPAPDPGPKKKRAKRSVLNQAQIAALQKAETIALAAQKEGYAAPLADRAITAEFVTGLLDDVDAARKQAASVVQSTNQKTGATLAEQTAQADVVHALQEVQAAARQKYFLSDPSKLADYYIGENLDASFELLEQYKVGILAKLAADTLPGISAEKITAIGTLWQALLDERAAQGTAQGDATGGRGTLEDQIKAITGQRMTIQFAADAEWPWHKKSSAVARKDFQLPKGTVFAG